MLEFGKFLWNCVGEQETRRDGARRATSKPRRARRARQRLVNKYLQINKTLPEWNNMFYFGNLAIF
jgi:hypothetical protein